jgi:5'-methylthioadenosine phosphorylase
MERAEIGVFGGSGLYTLLEAVEEVKVDTPYGAPSDLVALGKIEGRRVAFLPRHGKRHQYPPHVIPYRANLWAMKSLGVTRIVAPCVVGSLQPHIKPGDIVVCDQFIDRTRGRKDTFYDGPVATHISTAEPYCPELRRIVTEATEALGFTIHRRGTVVVIQGPRFSTKAESLWFKGQGWDVINMTQYPEVVLARELEICYVNISLVTDYDVWREEPVSAEVVQRVFSANIENVKRLIHRVIPNIPPGRSCPCLTALQSSRL